MRDEDTGAGGRRRTTGRAAAACPHPRCSACPLLARPYPEQLAAKRAQVLSAFQRHFAADAVPEIQPVRPSPRELGYRAGAKLVVHRGRGGVGLGLYRPGTHRVVEIPRCPVHHPLAARGIRALARLLHQAPGLAGPGGQGWLRYAAFQVSEAEERLLATVVTRTADRAAVLSSLAARLREAVPELSGLVWNVNPTAGNEIFGPEWRTIWGEGCLRERLGRIWVRASAGAFLQANRAQASWVYESAAGWLRAGPGDTLLDLFCGVGGLALNLAPAVRQVVGVEVNPGAVADARALAQEHGAANAAFRAGPAEVEVATLLREGFRPDLVTVNPPRRGMGPTLAEAIRAAGPRAVLYLSCNPETLAMDTALLCAGGGYRVELVQPVDFFPQTEHVETVALLSH